MAKALTSPYAGGQAHASRSRVLRSVIVRICWHVAVVAISVTTLAPLAWVVSTSLTETGSEFDFPPRFIPDPIVWDNYAKALTALPFHLFFLNTVLVEIGTLSGILVTASMVAFAFARLRYPGRDLWFMILISTLMLPGIVTLIPHYVIFKNLGWIDTLLPLTVPLWFGGHPFNIFLIRQFYLTIPFELDEAARIDGANSFWIYSRIMLPLSGPVLASVAILAFVYHWNDFLEPLIFLNSIPNLTMAIGLKLFISQNAGYWNLMMAAAAAMVVPVLVLFIALQRYFTKGIVLTGIAGR